MLAGMLSIASFQYWLASAPTAPMSAPSSPTATSCRKWLLPRSRWSWIAYATAACVRSERSFLCWSTMNAAILLFRSSAFSHVPWLVMPSPASMQYTKLPFSSRTGPRPEPW